MQLTHALAWTDEQKAGQAELNRKLNEARRSPAEGRPVPDEARRDGTMRR